MNIHREISRALATKGEYMSNKDKRRLVGIFYNLSAKKKDKETYKIGDSKQNNRVNRRRLKANLKARTCEYVYEDHKLRQVKGALWEIV